MYMLLFLILDQNVSRTNTPPYT